MKVSKITTSFLALAFLASSVSVSANYYPPQQQQYQGYASYVPAGTPISVNLSQALGSEISRVGETFRASLAGPIYAGGQMVAPPGSQIEGTVVGIEPPGRAGKPASMDLRLTTIVTPNGQRIPLSATIDKANFQLQADGSRMGSLAKNTAGGAAAGSLTSMLVGTMDGKKGGMGKNAALGAGMGAVAGLGFGAFKKGQDLIIQSGSTIPFILDTPIQVSNSAPPPQQVSPEYGGYQAPSQGGYQQVPTYSTPPSGGGFVDPIANPGYQGQTPSNPYYD